MKFKHTFHVFVDNFQVIYKQLVYRLVIGVIAALLSAACIYPFINGLMQSQAFTNLVEGIKNFALNFFKGEFTGLPDISQSVKDAFEDLMVLFRTELGNLTITIILLVIVHIVEKWFSGMGNYAAAAVINDKMAMRAKSPFLATMIKNFKQAAIYNAIYVPLSVIYDGAISIAMFFLLYFLVVHSVIPFFVALFLFVLILIVAISFKMTFTTDWLPALIRGKMKQREAFAYTFSRKNKDTLNVLSNFVILILLIMSVNVIAFVSTFGVATLIAIPASYVILLCFEMVNYFDREQIKYSIGDNAIVMPVKEHTPTREEFFRGEDEGRQ